MAEDMRDHIEVLPLEDVMGDRFGRYSKYIIQERAIPDVRDGLKPVQRRILYAMEEAGNTYEKGYRKSAKTVGNVIGNYHPHGDTSVYDAMVRLSQEWKMGEVLVEMQGNNGSMDGDPPAAMRYTEARLSKIASTLMDDLGKDTVEWVYNFDDTSKEPTVLPAPFPNLLLNGSTGISAGYATDIPPHNLGEIIDATIHLIKYPNAGLKKLMDYMPGPDFPTGGIIQGKEGLIEAYETGRGRVVVRSKTHIEDLRGGSQQIVATEIPYEVNKARIVQQIDDIRINKAIDGISEVRDETDRDGLRLVIVLDKGAQAEGILTYLFKNTDLQVNYNFNMVAIDNQTPEQLGLKRMLQAYIDFRIEVIQRRSRYDLKKAQDRLHIVDGLIRAISILDEVIATIRASKNKKDSKDNLMDRYDFTEAQAEAIVSMQLYRLSNTDVTQLEEESKDLQDKIKHLKEILGDSEVLNQVMIDELREMKKTFAKDRLTVIEDEIEDLEVDKEVLIAEEDTYVVVTKEGYVKRSSLRSYGASETKDLGLKDRDYPILARKMTTLDQVLIFTSHGNYINRPVYALPEIRWKDQGQHLSQTLSLNPGEEIIAAFALEDFDDSQRFVLVSKEGMIKQTEATHFEPKKNFNTQMSRAMNLKTDTDRVVAVRLVSARRKHDVLTVSKTYASRYELDEVSVVGPNAAGVKAMNLKEGDSIQGLVIMDQEIDTQEFMVVTQRGAMKKMDVNRLDIVSRNSRGQLILKTLKSKPHEVSLVVPVQTEDLTHRIWTDLGQTYDFQPEDFGLADRLSNGSFIFEDGDGIPNEYSLDWVSLLEATEDD